MSASWKAVLRKCGILGAALLLTAGAFGFYGLEFSYRAILYFLASFAVYRLMERGTGIRDKRVITASLVFSILLTASFAAGHQINLSEEPFFPDLSLLDWACLLPYGGVLFVCVLNLVDWILSRGVSFRRPEGKPDRKYWRNWFFLLTVLWLPYFLVFYPANLSLDSFECVQQAVGDVPYGNNHPAGFVAFLAVIMKLGMWIGDINFGIACFAVVQILIFASILGYVLYWLKGKGAPDWMIALCGAYYGLNPMIGTFAMTVWKDVLFGAFLLLLATWLYDVAESRGGVLASPRGLAQFALIALFLSLWRNSMAAGICVLAVVLTLCYRKQIRYFLPVCVVVLCLISLILGPVYDAAGIPKANAAESYGILLQQIGFTLRNGGIVDPESRAFLDAIIPTDLWAQLYGPGASDAVKFSPSFQNDFFNAHTGEFLRVWLKLMPANWKHYTKAWLMNTLGYYHIGTIETAYWYGIIPVQRAEELGIFRTDLIAAVTGTEIVASAVEAFLFYAKKLPVFSTLYSIAANVWVFALGLLICWLRKQHIREYFWGMLPLAALWLIIMATTPACYEFRYMFAFHLALPIVMVFLFRRDTEPGLT